MRRVDMQGQYAGFVSRLIAWLVDRGIIAVIIMINAWLTSFLAGVFRVDVYSCPAPVQWTDFGSLICWGVLTYIFAFSFLFAPLYTTFFWTLTGQTPGKMFVGVRVVRMDGKRMTFRVSVRRYIGYLASALAFGLGFIWIVFDDQRRGWHDKIAHTCVVYTWSARQNQPLIDRLTQKLFRRRQQLDQFSKKLDVSTDSVKKTYHDIRVNVEEVKQEWSDADDGPLDAP